MVVVGGNSLQSSEKFPLRANSMRRAGSSIPVRTQSKLREAAPRRVRGRATIAMNAASFERTLPVSPCRRLY
jgi:hypothetical protein